MNIILYKTVTCPKCKVIKAKLDAKKLSYIEEMDDTAIRAKGITEIPALEVDGELITNMGDINRWINAQEVNNG